MAERNVGRFVFGEQEGPVAAGDLGRAADHDPVFGAVMVHLQAQLGAGIDDDALDLEAFAGVDRVVPAPGPIDLAVRLREAAAFGLQARDDLLDVLGAVLVRDHDGVGRLHHDHVLATHCGHQTAAGVDQGVAAGLEHHFAARGIAVGVLGRHRPKRVPGADVRPARGERHDHALAELRCSGELFHHRVVDRIARAALEGCGVEADEVGVVTAGSNRRAAGAGHVRVEAADRAHPHGGLHHEDAAVPVVLAAGDVALGGGAVGLLDEFLQRAGALACFERGPRADVAVAGLGVVGDDAEGDERTLRRGLGADRNRLLKGREVGDDVIGRHHQQDRIALLRRGQRGEGERRRGVAPHRFEHDLRRSHTDLAQLLGDDEAVFLVGDHQRPWIHVHRRKALEAGGGFLQQGVVAGERQQLLGIALARGRPQTRAGAAGENHALDRHEGDRPWSEGLPRAIVRALSARGRRQIKISRSMRATPSRQSGRCRLKASRSRWVSRREFSGRAAAVG